MKIILFDGNAHQNLLPLTYTKPVGKLRMGAFSFAERWQNFTQKETTFLAENYLQKAFPTEIESNQPHLFVAANWLATPHQMEKASQLNKEEALFAGEQLLAIHTSLETFHSKKFNQKITIPEDEIVLIHRPWDLFTYNKQAIQIDYEWISKHKSSQSIPENNQVLHPENIYIGTHVKMNFATLNASEGPIIIMDDAEIMEGSILRGPLVIGEHAVTKLGAKIYGETTIGPYCKVGGEVSNSILMGYSNKGHDGFLGNSVLGEWCNLGADTNTSNLKNNYSPVKMYDIQSDTMIDTGLQFCGLVMGDHSKSAINTQFNTGTTVGVCANIFQAGFPPKWIPNFSWGSERYDFEKAMMAIEKMKNRRNLTLFKEEKEILRYLYDFA